jgi:outer membrane protein assembly factor BamD (BamD/ComL family)
MLPSLEDLSSCYKIALESKDPDLEKPAQNRMKTLAESFPSLQNGYEFRRNYPTSSYEKPVLVRMNKLASQTLHQGKLYQAIGEYQKALDQYNQILRYCSDMPVADEVKETIVDFQELQSNKG